MKTGAGLALAWAESKHEAELTMLAKDPSSLPPAICKWAFESPPTQLTVNQAAGVDQIC
jgi:hypothetical protein